MIALQPTRIDFDLLRNDVHRSLADLGQLEFGSFPMTERLVVRGEEVCGIYFCLHGPRNVKLNAICDLKRCKVIYYGTDGQRAGESSIRRNASTATPSDSSSATRSVHPVA